MRRVVVTGLGLVTPLGAGVGHVWKRLVNGESGIRAVQTFDVSDLPCKIAGTVPVGEGGNGHFDPDTVTDAKDRRKMDDFIVYTLGAAAEAVEDAGWTPEAEEDLERTGVLIGSGIGGLKIIFDGSITMNERGPRRVTPFFIPGHADQPGFGQVSIRYGFKGPNHSVVTACATGAHAIGDAARMIMLDDADVMVAGGAEAAVCRIGIAGFASARALSTGFNETPERASRPWDRDRDGFVMGEGAGIVVLEEMEHAKKRGARIYGEVIGYGMSGDAHHITSPPEDGNGGFRSMQGGAEAGEAEHRRDRLYQRARDLDPARRRDRARGGQAGVRRGRVQFVHVVHQVRHRAPARRRRQRRGDLFDHGDERRRRTAHAEPRKPF